MGATVLHESSIIKFHRTQNSLVRVSLLELALPVLDILEPVPMALKVPIKIRHPLVRRVYPLTLRSTLMSLRMYRGAFI